MSYLSARHKRGERFGPASLIALAPKGLVRFLSVGIVGLATHMGVITALLHFGLAKPVAWWLALAVATFVTWRLNQLFTFTPSGRPRMSEVWRYVLVTLVAQGISFGTFMGVIVMAPRFPPQLALMAGAVIATFFSYTGQRFFTFAAPKVEAAVVPEIPVI